MVTTVCLIDDDSMYLFLVKKLIEKQQVCDNILEFSKATEALSFLKENSSDSELLPDVILLDINMPEMNGWEFIKNYQQLKSSISKPITIYMVSSSVDEEDKMRSQALPEITDFMVKPLTAEKLNAICCVINQERKTA
jgi:CheY-like chemotaxis protein